jgi:hypothetical protein
MAMDDNDERPKTVRKNYKIYLEASKADLNNFI